MPIALSIALLAAAAAAPPGGEAAPLELPPIYQRLAELRAIAEQPAIAAAFVDTPIERIEYVWVDLYRVTAGGCHLEVEIVGLPVPDGVGGGGGSRCGRGERVCGGEGRAAPCERERGRLLTECF